MRLGRGGLLGGAKRDGREKANHNKGCEETKSSAEA